MASLRKLSSLSQLVPRDIFVGTSLILRQEGRFLYGLRPARREGDRFILELTGIGGGLEMEDASISAGVVREAREEMGCDVRLIPCQTTLVVRGPQDIEWVSFEAGERPAVVVFRRYRTPPHQPWHSENKGEACLIVFAAELQGEPRPAMELPHLIWLAPEQVLETGQDDVPLARLLEQGALLVGEKAQPLPPESWARLTDSQEALVLALGQDARAFYLSLTT